MVSLIGDPHTLTVYDSEDCEIEHPGCPECGVDAYYEDGPADTPEGSPYRCLSNHCFYSREEWVPVERCKAQPPKGPNSWWMSDDQWEAGLCHCILVKGHEGPHDCKHGTPWTSPKT